MKAIITLLSVACFNTLWAQTKPQLNWFCGEGTNYYNVTGGKAGSSATFYSSVTGGKCLGAYTLDQNGHITLSETETFKPAMVLNSGGNNQVAHIEQREFSIQSVEVKPKDRHALISWKSETADPANMAFTLLRNTDGYTWQIAARIDAEANIKDQLYHYSEPWNGITVLYRIAVENKILGTRYTTKSAMLAANIAISIFPTNVSDMLCIELPGVSTESDYKVMKRNAKGPADFYA